MESAQDKSPLPFLDALGALKSRPRRGWVVRGIESPESVSAHSLHTAVMSWILAADMPDHMQLKVLKMAITHDFAEAITGDIIPADNVSKERKHQREDLAMRYLGCLAHPVIPAFAKEMKNLWNEFEEGNTQAARLVKDADKLDCMTQAIRYERQHNRRDLDEFFGLKSQITSSGANELADKLLSEREAFSLWRKMDIAIVFVIGGPGSGKGTVCSRLAREQNFSHISAGDLLRDEADIESSRYKTFIEDSFRSSVVIPAPLTVELLKKSITKASRKTELILLDGFPRSIEQAQAFEEQVSRHYGVICLDCQDEVMIDRLRNRSKASGRIDDEEHVILGRIKTFRDDTKAVESYLRSHAQVFRQVCDALN